MFRQKKVMITVRVEKAEDHALVRHLNERAFGRPNEAALVDALRAAAHPQISLVAVKDGQVAGHIFFSPVSVESGDAIFMAMSLAPMAVMPEHQRQGIGSALVQEGLRECQQVGCKAVVVLGHPEYYRRFGFIPASQKGLRCEYPVPDEVFMVVELQPDALVGQQGLVTYRPEFSEV